MTKVRSSTCLRCQCYEGQQGWTGEWQPQTHINNCFNQFISQFVSCERASTDILRTTSIPLTSTPSTSVTVTCWLKTVKPRVLSHADCQVGAFQRLEHCPPSGKTGSLRRFPTACPPHTERRVSNWLIFLIFWHHDIVSRLDNPNLLCRCFH